MIQINIEKEPSGELKKDLYISEETISNNKKNTDHDDLKLTLIDKFEYLSQQISELKDSKLLSINTNNEFNEADHFYDNYEQNQSSFISIEAGRQKLLKMRNEIQFENEFNVNWPGPTANILQKSIIEEVLQIKPLDIEGYKALPEFKWHLENNPVLMINYLEIWWPKINEVIKNINWLEV